MTRYFFFGSGDKYLALICGFWIFPGAAVEFSTRLGWHGFPPFGNGSCPYAYHFIPGFTLCICMYVVDLLQCSFRSDIQLCIWLMWLFSSGKASCPMTNTYTFMGDGIPTYTPMYKNPSLDRHTHECIQTTSPLLALSSSRRRQLQT